MRILGGVIGAVLGFLAGVLLCVLLSFDNRQDPITPALLALLVAGPAGVIAGAFGGTKLVTLLLAPRAAGEDATRRSGGVANGALKAIGIFFGCVVVAGAGYYAYALVTATPWLKPGGTVLLFEIRFPEGTALPAANDIGFELQTDINTMPGKVRSDQFRTDGQRPVIVGQVDLAFRTPNRQLEVTMPGRVSSIYPIGLAAGAPHAGQFGRWEPHSNGSEFRYRAKWPGRD